jgi:hypothetical protein
MDLKALTKILRRRTALSNLLREIADAIFEMVPCDGMKFDLTDERGGLWSRIVKRGSDPERPGLGAVSRLKSNETFEVSEEEGVHQVVVPLGLGDQTAGRWTLRRRSGAFSAPELETVKSLADLLSIALRARPFDAPAKTLRFGEEPGTLV